MKRLHIVGCPRSGTSLMARLMSTCFKSDNKYRHEINIFERPVGVSDLFISKKPTDVRLIKPLLEADDKLYVLYMIRDPRDVITSLEAPANRRYFSNFRIWRECNDAAKTLIGHNRFCPVRYEDLVSEPDITQNRLMQVFPFMEKISNFSNYAYCYGKKQDLDKDMQPVSADGIGKWMRHLPRIKAQLILHPDLAESLISNAYEQDYAWTQHLDNIEPDFSPGRYTESKPHLFQKWEAEFRTWLKIRKYLQGI